MKTIEETTKKKETVRISKKDLLRLLAENEQQLNHITELQTRLNELLEENRQLKMEKLPVKQAPQPAVEPKPYDPDDDDTFPDYRPAEDFHPQHINPNIYFDGAHGLGSGRRFGSNG